MGVRAYEQGRMNGRQNGLDDGEQILYGLSTAGIEITTEKLFGGLKIAYGKGVADKAAGKAITKITERSACCSLSYTKSTKANKSYTLTFF